MSIPATNPSTSDAGSGNPITYQVQGYIKRSFRRILGSPFANTTICKPGQDNLLLTMQNLKTLQKFYCNDRKKYEESNLGKRIAMMSAQLIRGTCNPNNQTEWTACLLRKIDDVAAIVLNYRVTNKEREEIAMQIKEAIPNLYADERNQATTALAKQKQQQTDSLRKNELEEIQKTIDLLEDQTPAVNSSTQEKNAKRLRQARDLRDGTARSNETCTNSGCYPQASMSRQIVEEPTQALEEEIMDLEKKIKCTTEFFVTKITQHITTRILTLTPTDSARLTEHITFLVNGQNREGLKALVAAETAVNLMEKLPPERSHKQLRQ